MLKMHKLMQYGVEFEDSRMFRSYFVDPLLGHNQWLVKAITWSS